MSVSLFPTLLENGEKQMKTEKEKWLCVEISADTMRRLLMENQLCAAELNCLDCKSKDCLLRLCLECCTPKKCWHQEARSPQGLFPDTKTVGMPPKRITTS
jgi:hypothetical protein